MHRKNIIWIEATNVLSHYDAIEHEFASRVIVTCVTLHRSHLAADSGTLWVSGLSAELFICTIVPKDNADQSRQSQPCQTNLPWSVV